MYLHRLPHFSPVHDEGVGRLAEVVLVDGGGGRVATHRAAALAATTHGSRGHDTTRPV